MKRVVLTGGSGFVGNNVARRLVREGHEVHLLLRPGFEPWRLQDLAGQVTTHQVHFADTGELKRVFQESRPHWIFHLAAYGAYPGQRDFERMLATNLHATINLVTAALERGFESFIHAGSSSEYGYKAEAPGETTFLEPNSHYAVAKAAATLYCSHMAREHELPVSTLRLYSVYGPFEEPTRLIPTLILKGLNAELPPLVNPATARDFIYVDDVVDAFIACATHGKTPSDVYNLGTGRQTTLTEAVTVAREVLNLSITPEWGTMPDRQWDTAAWQADISSLSRDLAWRPQWDFRAGFVATLHWFQENPALLDFYRWRQTQSQ